MESSVPTGGTRTDVGPFFRSLPLPALACQVERGTDGAPLDLLIAEANDAVAAAGGGNGSALPGRRFGEVFGSAALAAVLPRVVSALDAVPSRDAPPSAPLDRPWVTATVQAVGPDLVALVSTASVERRAAATALAANDALHRSALETLNEGVVVEDLQGRILAANASASRILGLTPAELLGLDAYDGRWQGKDGDGRPVGGEGYASQTVLRTGEAVRDLVVDVARPDGTRILLRYNGEPLRDASGAMTGVVVSFEDVTERIAAERALVQRTEELARALADLEEARDLTGLGVWRRDLVTGEGTWSPRLFALFGGDPDGPPPNAADADSMLDADTIRRRTDALVESARTGLPWELEVEVHPTEGDSRWMVLHGVTDVDADGRPVAVHGTALDITMSKRAELVLREFTAELERRVAERTAELEAANEELQSFTYSVSHDLRAPVRAIAGFARLLELRNAEQLDEAGRHRLANITSAGEAMGRIIDDLLAYSRVGRTAVRAEPVELEAVLDRVLTACAATLDATNGQVEVARPLAAPLGDPTLLELVLLNLVQNALVHRRHGADPRVRLASEVEDARVVIRVDDNGLGIPAEVRERIFEPFFRADPDETHPGTGIGLAIVRRSVTAMGGAVSVDSEPGVGSTFRVELPADPAT
ncbi:MAG: ATP-binding protein [Chloroflexota bacterium]